MTIVRIGSVGGMKIVDGIEAGNRVAVVPRRIEHFPEGRSEHRVAEFAQLAEREPRYVDEIAAKIIELSSHGSLLNPASSSPDRSARRTRRS
jgi:hypothetical protein